MIDGSCIASVCTARRRHRVQPISAAGLLTGDLAGALWMVDLDTGDKTLVLDDPLFAPGGVDIARDGTI